MAVEDVSFAVQKGEILTLIGPSGHGKSTILRMLNRLIEPTEGIVKIEGLPIERMEISQLRQSMGYVIQKKGFFPHLTVEQNVALAQIARVRTFHKGDKARIRRRVEELLNLVRLGPKTFLKRYPKELSGGQLQRVCIARALMADPPILLLDEPFGALDPMTRARLHREFWELNQKLHKTIILITHDLGEAFKLSNHILLLNKGRIIQRGRGRDDFLKRPVNQFARDFVQAQTEGLVENHP